MTLNLLEHLQREFDSCSAIEVPGLGTKPMLTPGSEEELCEALVFAQQERKLVLPIGCGSKLTWLPALENVGFVLSTRELTGLIAYEPEDGTLTARAGSQMQALEQEVAGGGHRMTPQVPHTVESTLGGVLASNQTGFDRAAFGPARHHVLGMRVALADGSTARSGGRLVKNVTGFDMHRLYSGSFGSLCVILEASLRLFPAHEKSYLLRKEFEEVGTALQHGRLLAERGFEPRALGIELQPGGAALLSVYLAGRTEPLQWIHEQISALLPGATSHQDEAAEERVLELREAGYRDGRWTDLRATCPPSRLAACVAIVQRLEPSAHVHIRPAIAELLIHGKPELEPSRLGPLERALVAAGARTLRRGTTPKARPVVGADLHPSKAVQRMMEKLKRELDPSETLAGRIPPPTSTQPEN